MDDLDWHSRLPGAALLNAADAFPELARLREDFDIIYFLDVCSGIEAAILYDEIHCTAFGPGATQILEPLAEVGAIYDAKLRAFDPSRAADDVKKRVRAASLITRLRSPKFLSALVFDVAIIAR
jgi:hypothetical protein